MHVSDENLKVLIDVLAERLDDDLDMLSDSNFMDERESVKMTWVVKDLLENLRQEQRSRGMGRGFKTTNEGLEHHFPGMSNAPEDSVLGNVIVDLREFMDLQSQLGEVQAELGDLKAQGNDHREQLNDIRPQLVSVLEIVDLLRARDPDVMFWGRIRRFEMRMEAQLMGLGGLLRALEEKLQALEVQSDDRWVRTQKAGQALSRQVETLHLVMEGHVGETGTKH